MIDKTKVAIRASTQEHLDIEDIVDGIVILKDGGACVVLSATAINFGLLSGKEQDATIYAYAGLLNSLTFPIQIVIRSQRKDISEYLHLLEQTASKEKRELIKNQIIKYRNFVQETVRKNNVLDKKFFLVIPMNILELGISQTLTTTFRPKKGLPLNKDHILKKAKINLYPKRDHLLRLLGRLGLQGRQLKTKELIRLYFTIYNPHSPSQTILEPNQYQTPLVQTTPASKPEVKTSPIAPPERVVVSPEPDLQNQISGLIQSSIK